MYIGEEKAHRRTHPFNSFIKHSFTDNNQALAELCWIELLKPCMADVVVIHYYTKRKNLPCNGCQINVTKEAALLLFECIH